MLRHTKLLCTTNPTSPDTAAAIPGLSTDHDCMHYIHCTCSMYLLISCMPAGAVQTCISCPVELLKIRLQLQHALPGTPGYVGPWGMLHRVVAQEGVLGAYSKSSICCMLGVVRGLLGYVGPWGMLHQMVAQGGVRGACMGADSKGSSGWMLGVVRGMSGCVGPWGMLHRVVAQEGVLSELMDPCSS
jgi:hypothetical protein